MTRLVSAKSLSCIVPPGTLCPTSPSLPWVAWASLPHVHRYYTTLRLPTVPLGGFACRSPSRYLACFHRSWYPSRAHDRMEASEHARAFRHPVPHSGTVVKEIGGSPKFPRYPSGHMPRSQTPVVSSTLAKTCPELLPSGACKPSAFPSVHRERYPLVHDSTHVGAQSRGLRPRYTRLHTAPYGEARGFATDRLARR